LFCRGCGAQQDPPAADPTPLAQNAQAPEAAPPAAYAYGATILPGGDVLPVQSAAHGRSDAYGPAPVGSGVPLVVAVVALLLAVGGVLVLVEAIRGMVSIGSGLWAGEQFVRAFAVLAFVVLLVFGSFGAGLAVVAVSLWRGSRVGRAMACVLAGSVAFAEIVSTYRTTSDKWTMAVCLVVVVALILPVSGRFFAASDGRPTAVVMSVLLIGFFAWDFALFGAALVAFGHYDHKDLATGAVMLAAAVLLVLVNRAISAGSTWARMAASGLLAAASITLLVAEGRQLPSLALAALSAATVAMLWFSPDAQEHFSGLPGHRPQLLGAPGARLAVGLVAVLAVAGVIAAGYIPNSGSSDFYAGNNYYPPDTDTYTPPSDTGPAYDGAVDTPDAYSWSFDEDSDDGGSGTVTLSVGDASSYEYGTTNGDATLGSCDVDAGSSLMIPFDLTFEGAGDSAATLGISFAGIGDQSIPNIDGVELYEEAQYDDGAACYGDGDGGSSFDTYTTDALDDGRSATTHGFFVVSGYTDADASESEILDDAILTVDESESVGPEDDVVVTVSDASGPGLEDNGSSYSFALSGDLEEAGE
jgi:hypothetical protein